MKHFGMTSTLLDELLGEAIVRKRQRCSFETTYSHEIVKDWLESAIENNAEEWKIVIPLFNGNARSKCRAISDWPNKAQTKYVIRWLRNHSCKDAEDLLEGACEPLAFYLSLSIKSALQQGAFEDLNKSHACALESLELKRPSEAAKVVFHNYFHHENRGPVFWGSTFEGSHVDFLFGNEAMKRKVSVAAKSMSNFSFMPLYILSYIFDNDELNDEDLSIPTTVESAQYSIHAVGLIFDTLNRRIIVADPNGPLIPGSNMEFVKTPLTKRISPPSTTVSSFDMDKLRIRKKRKREQL